MKRIFLASLVLSFVGFIYAATDTKDPIKIDVAINKIIAKGYKNIKEIKFKNGFYEAEVVNEFGVELNLRVNSKTGDVEVPNDTPKELTMLEALKKLQKEGYKDITKMIFDDDSYEVSATDKDGNKVGLEINAKTGEIRKDWF